MRVRTAVGGVLTAAVMVGGGGVANAAHAPNRYHGPQDKPAWLTTRCQVEDQNNCYWNARQQGNGWGHSFWAIPVGANKVAIVYWNKRYNRHHGFVTSR